METLIESNHFIELENNVRVALTHLTLRLNCTLVLKKLNGDLWSRFSEMILKARFLIE